MNYVNHEKIKIFKVTFLNSPINAFFLYFDKFFYNFFFMYLKLRNIQNLSAKYYQENKERLQKFS